MKFIPFVALILLLLPTVYAIECGDTIEEPITLTNNLTCEESALILTANLDCNGYTIQGNNLGNGIHIQENNIQLQNCIIQNFENAILVDGFSNTEIKNNEIQNNNVGIQLINAQATINNNLIQNNFFFGIYTKNSEGTFEPNTFNNNGENIQQITLEEDPEQARIQEQKLSQQQLLRTSLKLEYNLDQVSEELFNERLQRLQDFLDNAQIQRDIKRMRDGTKVTLTITPNPNLKLINISIYERIPKCFAQLVDSIVFEQPPEILEEDPLVKIIIGDVTTPVSLSYEANTVITESCEELFAAIGLAEEIIELKEEEELVRAGPQAVVKKFWLQAIGLAVIIIILGYLVIKVKKNENK